MKIKIFFLIALLSLFLLKCKKDTKNEPHNNTIVTYEKKEEIGSKGEIIQIANQNLPPKEDYVKNPKFIINPPIQARVVNKVLLIIGDQWKDPASFFIDDDSDFKRVVILLKSWCIPFDIVRLDQEKLDMYYFLNTENKPKYGCVIWLCPPILSSKDDNITILQKAVVNYGINLIVIGDRARHRVVQSLLGISWQGEISSGESLSIPTNSFITSANNDSIVFKNEFKTERIAIVKIVNSEVLVKRGELPILTLHSFPKGACTIWLWTDPKSPLEKQIERTWLRRALCYTIGFMVYKNWKNHVLLRMDDPGSAQNAWLKRWSYPTLTRSQIHERIITPLKKHSAILNIFVCPGFVNDSTRSIEPSWERRFSDSFGNLQDYPSTKKGLDDGLKQKVFEIQCHGWTHLLPDLDTKPGPWWGSPIDGERSEEEWYREFHDGLRNQDIPVAVQLRRMRISRSWIQQQFGQIPLAFIPPGWGVSNSRSNNTWCVAVRAGFGWMDGYLGEDLAVKGWNFGGSDDVPDFVSIPPDGHDFGLTYQPQALEKYLQGRGICKYISFNELIAYTHCKISAYFDDSLYIQINSSNPLCSSFNSNKAEWTIELGPKILKQFKGYPGILTISGRRKNVSSVEHLKIVSKISKYIEISLKKD